jgi:hypothetical protein
MNVTPPAEPPTWATWRSNPETHAAQVGPDQGYLLELRGWRALAWKAGSTGFELAAGVSAMTVDELSSIATSLEPAGK